jgi:glycosyltransferase involved in cell wall biosynthesis
MHLFSKFHISLKVSMRILHLIDNYPPWGSGGTEIFCARLCQQLKDSGIEVTVALHQAGSLPEPGYYKCEGIPVVILPSIPDYRDRAGDFKRTTFNAVGFPELLDKYQPDILHLHGFTQTKGLTHIQWAKNKGIKVILTFHTPGISCLRDSLLWNGREICDGEILISRCAECRLHNAGVPEPLGKLLSHIEIPGLKVNNSKINYVLTSRQWTKLHQQAWLEMIDSIDVLHVLAEWAREVALINRAPYEKVHLIRTFGPEPIFTPASTKESNQNYLNLVYVGRCNFVKGIHIIIDAIQLLASNFPIQVTFFALGWNNNEYGRQQKNRIQNDPRFIIRESLPNDKLLQELSQYDACLVPSIWLETGPLTVLEAFAAGIPVIGSRRGGIAELVQDGVDGMLFEPGNAQALAQILENLLYDLSLLINLKKNVKPPRNTHDFTQDMMNLYSQLMKFKS